MGMLFSDFGRKMCRDKLGKGQSVSGGEGLVKQQRVMSLH